MSNKILDKKDVKLKFSTRLQQLCKAWQEMNRGPLMHRQKILQSWSSGYYDEGYSRDHQINLIDRGISTVVPFLVEGNPRVMVETNFANVKPWAYIN